MSRSNELPAEDGGTVLQEYVEDVRILECGTTAEPRYRFEAPFHTDVVFESREKATLYADVYFDVNGFQEAGTGEIGIPPEIVQAGKDTLAAYLIAQPGRSKDWVASFYGTRPEKLDQYVSWVRSRAEELRREARTQNAE
jgi:hypothetical protein